MERVPAQDCSPEEIEHLCYRMVLSSRRVLRLVLTNLSESVGTRASGLAGE